MKAQMKFQKILSLLTLIIGALCLIYGLCFFSGNLSDLMFYKSENWSSYLYDYAEMSDYFIMDGQLFVSIMVVLSIVYILSAGFLYVTDTNKRRKYYITNYISIGVTIAVTAATAIFCLIFMFVLLADFNAIEINFDDTSYGLGYMYNELKEQGAPIVGTGVYMFIIGMVVSLIALCNTVAWALALAWKVKLMKGEKALLEGVRAQEAV